MTAAWIRLMARDSLATGTVQPVRLAGRDLAIACTPEGVFALEDRCSHAEARMSEGRLRGCRLTCPMHGAAFDVRDGRVLGRPASEPLRTFPVRIEEGFVEVLLPDSDEGVTAGAR